MRYLDLRNLLGGDSMTKRILLSKNGISYKVSALIDTGANGYALIDSALLKSLSSFLKPLIRILPVPFPVKGYNGSRGSTITYYILLNLCIDQRIQSFTPFLITNLGNYRVILGRAWLEEHKVSINCASRKLTWPDSYPPTVSFAKNIEITNTKWQNLDQYHQRNATRRDTVLERSLSEYEARRQETLSQLPPKSPPIPIKHSFTNSTPTPPRVEGVTFSKDHSRNILIIKRELNATEPNSAPFPVSTPKRTRNQIAKCKIPLSSLNICAISAYAFRIIARNQRGAELFSTLFYKIDRLIRDN
ncbi:hypothetical protein PZA11_006311 [Diplocarpon coronariae]